MVSSRNPFLREKLSTVDLLVLTSSGQLLFIMKTLLTLFTKQATLNKEVNCTEPSRSVSVP